MLIQELEKIFNIWALNSFKKHFFIYTLKACLYEANRLNKVRFPTLLN